MFYSKFPEGLRVLVFDEDPEYLLTLEKYLQEFQYEVTTCNDEQKAMYLLRNHRNRFNIAIIEVHNSDCDRFRLISEIGLEMDLSVIIMSKDDSIKSVINWMRNGACDYLIKPIRAKDLQFIFKHVVKKIRGRSVVTGEAEERAAREKSSSVGDSTIRSPNERKLSICLDTQDNEEDHYDHYHGRACASTSKKRRVVWDDELHKKFIDAVEYLGIDKAVPKKILEIMNVENISRENVASHLQKFRINQKKRNDEIGREEKNLSLMPRQEGIMYVGEDATDFYRGRNDQYSMHHINNIPDQPYVQQFTTNPNNHTTQLISPNGHHHDGVSVAVSDRNVVMTNQHHHQISDSPIEESLAYIHFNEDEDGVANLEDISLSYHESPMVTNGHHHLFDSFRVMNVHETKPSPMVHLPSFIYSYTHYSFLDQLESGVCNNYGGFFVNNSKLN